MAVTPLQLPLERVLEGAAIVYTRERVGNGAALDRVEGGRLDDGGVHALRVDVQEEVEQRDPLSDVAAEAPQQLPAVPGQVAPQPLRLGFGDVEVRELLQSGGVGVGRRGHLANGCGHGDRAQQTAYRRR